MKRAVVLASGGVDSTTLAYYLAAHNCRPILFSIFYGQRHRKELESVARIQSVTGWEWHRLDLPYLGLIFRPSSLTDEKLPVPEGHYTDPTMRLTIVPYRNLILLSLGASLAIKLGVEGVAYAAHTGDHVIYPDCRVEFAEAYRRVLEVGIEGFLSPPELITPFITWTKADIVREGSALGVPYSITWSCYQGQEKHCGRCGTCVERKEAFSLAGVEDPTCYEE